MPSRIAELASQTFREAPSAASNDARQRALKIKRSLRLGIITALPKEAAAVRAVFGGHCLEMPNHRRTHATCYLHRFESSRSGRTLEVLIALANSMGNNSAAVTAASILMEFPNIEDLIIVGIAGAIPVPVRPNRTQHDYQRHVRLGDIIVSTDGIVQYDFVRLDRDKSECRKQATRPSPRLTSAVQQIRVEEEAGHHEWEGFLSKSLSENGIRRPRTDRIIDDVASGAHQATGGQTFLQHPRKQARRRPNAPLVHYGLIGSANVLLKNSLERDRLGAEHGVRAVEMEGSGIADAAWNLAAGYIAVRSACDYCDSRKDDVWQQYASYAAAAYTRSIVERALNQDVLAVTPKLLAGPTTTGGT